MSERNRWICERETVLLTSPVMDIIQQDCRLSEHGREHRFFLLRSRDWCNVIPITSDGKVVLVRQFRIGTSSHTLETPGGIVDAKDQDPARAAIREMEEETGYTLSAHGKTIDLGWSHPNPAILDNRVHFIAVGPVVKTREQNLDPGEMIETLEVPIEDIPGLIQREEITHALSLNALFRLSLTLQTGRDSLITALKELQKPLPAPEFG